MIVPASLAEAEGCRTYQASVERPKLIVEAKVGRLTARAIIRLGSAILADRPVRLIT